LEVVLGIGRFDADRDQEIPGEEAVLMENADLGRRSHRSDTLMSRT
jgi:hypothetical protein